jgi:polysaccharide pyruvyl transferase WcaK-like protein
MQIGGDNYTYDYRLPDIFVDLDRYLIRHKVPIILWGCSVGPFDSIPAYHKYIIDHFKAMKYIFPRESISYNYLIKNKLNNVMLMSDPAFLLEACAPESIKFNVPLSGRYVGLNLSPLIAKYVTGGDMGALVKCASNIVRNIVAITNMSVLLIPHVTLDTNDDYIFLRNVYDSCDKTIKPYVYCVSNNLTAAETKWVISRCEIFIGARMHSVIAALSSCIPTLTLSYSSKSVGLNYDIYGNMDCLVVMDKYFESNILAKLEYILSNKSNISKHLCVNMPHVTDNALSAGKYLKHLLSTR